MAQSRLPGTLPPPTEAHRNHMAAVRKEREAADVVEVAAEALKAARKLLKEAAAERQRAEDDLAAIEAGRRPERSAQA